MEFNLAQVFRGVAEAAPDRECIVWRDRRITYGDVDERTDQLAQVLHDHGLRAHEERSALEDHESGQDQLALYLYNGNEYLEGMLGAYKARVAPFNVNYRYVAEELEYLLNDSGARGIVYHGAFAPTLAEVRDRIPGLDLLLQVEDGSGNDLLPGALDYDETLAASSSEPLDEEPSPDDLYILYTGGTTGMPKGVLWRQADIFVAALGGRRQDTREEWASMEELVEAAAGGGARVLPAPPFMHGAAHWLAWNAFTSGNTIVLPDTVARLDPADVWGTIEQEKANALLMVGDAFGRPLLDELRSGSYDTSTLMLLISGGAPLSPGVKQGFLEELPQAMLMDGLGSSEAGSQGRQMHVSGAAPTTGTFGLDPGARVLSGDLSRLLEPGDEEIGWLAQMGRVPLGYLGDPEKSARTFPTVDGVRYAVPGDRARHLEDGGVELLGRDSVTINSGGEKVFAEEVEAALLTHPAVYDAVVVGRPSERWGQEVVAVVALAEGAAATERELIDACTAHIARYKLPKAVIVRSEIVRSPAGKADYRWAKDVTVSAQ